MKNPFQIHDSEMYDLYLACGLWGKFNYYEFLEELLKINEK